MFRRKEKLSVVFIAISLLFSSTVSAEAREIQTKYPLNIVSADFAAKLPAKPVRIISLSPSATEIIFAINAGSQVLAVDDNSNYPANVPTSALSGFAPNLEAIVALDPDFVILNNDSTKSDAIHKSLTNLGIPVMMEEAARNLNDVYREITIIGKAVDQQEKARKLIVSMKKRIAKVIKSSKKVKSQRFFHELDNTLYTATSKTFIGNVYRDLGLKNVADAASGADSSGYPQLSAEYLIRSNPQIIFLADAQYGESISTVKARPGWQSIAAVKNGRIIELPADIPSRWGPRIVDFYELVAKSIK
ncbi:MAG: ABC transporter substrate-binding protein [Actinomycetales bacterium]|nr:ABC transporter substrate-binding protein [Actinomycetales bacterium]